MCFHCSLFKKGNNMISANGIVFNVTEQCNMRCSHCYRKINNNRLEVDDILRFIKVFDIEKKLSRVIISGGEVLLYQQLDALLHSLNGRYNIRINTNGILLDEYFDILKDINKLKIQISLDGYDEQTYYKIRNINMFDKVLTNAIMAKKLGFNISFRTTLTSLTINDYQRFIEISEYLGIPITLRPMVNTLEERQKPIALTQEAVDLWNQRVKDNDEYKYVSENKNQINKCALFGENNPLSTIIVESDGMIYPCALFEKEKYKIGNIKVTSLSQIDEKFQEVSNCIRSLFQEEKCKKCLYRKEYENTACVAACVIGNSKCFYNKI